MTSARFMPEEMGGDIELRLAPMQHEKRLLLVPSAVFCLAAVGSSWAGAAGLATAAVAGLAILLPDLMYTLTVRQLVKQHRATSVVAARALRARVWKFASTVVFLAVGLGILGEALVVAVWVAAVITQAAVPPVVLLWVHSQDS